MDADDGLIPSRRRRQAARDLELDPDDAPEYDPKPLFAANPAEEEEAREAAREEFEAAEAARMEEELGASGKQLGREQVRQMVRIHLDLTNDRRDASDAWIDARFDRFDEDRNGTVDDSEWENLLRSMEPKIAAITSKPPWGIEMEVNHNSAMAVTRVQDGSIAARSGIEVAIPLQLMNICI